MSQKPAVIAFNLGELGNEALARVDLENYRRGAAMMENIIPMVQGGMTKAPGTILVTAAMDNGLTVLRPFVAAEDASIMLELAANRVRFHETSGPMRAQGTNVVVGGWSTVAAPAPTGGSTPPDGGSGGGGLGDLGLGGYGGYGFNWSGFSINHH